MIKLALAIGFTSVLGLALYVIISAYALLSKKENQNKQPKTINRKTWNR